MNNRWLFGVVLLLASSKVVSERGVSPNLKEMRANCAFYFDDPVPSGIVRTSVHDLTIEVRQVTLELSLQSTEGQGSGSIHLVCPTRGRSQADAPLRSGGGSDRVPSPSEIIEREDSAGRYYRLVAWEKPIEGSNWRGNVAYSDYMFGDGQKSRVDYLLMCHATVAAPCVEYTGDPASPLAPTGLESLLNLMRALHFRIR